MRLLPGLAFLAACSFSPPHLLGAKQSCLDWFKACEEKAISCGTPVDSAEATYREWAATCDRVVWSNSSEVHDECIPAVLAATCEESAAMRCGQFAHL